MICDGLSQAAAAAMIHEILKRVLLQAAAQVVPAPLSAYDEVFPGRCTHCLDRPSFAGSIRFTFA